MLFTVLQFHSCPLHIVVRIQCYSKVNAPAPLLPLNCNASGLAIPIAAMELTPAGWGLAMGIGSPPPPPPAAISPMKSSPPPSFALQIDDASTELSSTLLLLLLAAAPATAAARLLCFACIIRPTVTKKTLPNDTREITPAAAIAEVLPLGLISHFLSTSMFVLFGVVVGNPSIDSVDTSWLVDDVASVKADPPPSSSLSLLSLNDENSCASASEPSPWIASPSSVMAEEEEESALLLLLLSNSISNDIPA
mmetsp:Transcript_18589/g.27796  ORF Transcript_18589/g.27796 Transcript_18589/m.27796 type:complete len:251 (-) Transcript_18589:2-754(-)